MRNATQTEEDALLEETVDGRFRLEQKLGEGAVGRVYRAKQLSIDRPVAIKILHGEFRRDEEYQKRFRREAELISSFNHPNIVRLVDYGQDRELGLTYLAMEYVEGLELYELMQKGRLDPRCALEITHQVAAGLSAAHDAKIIHRDLKSSNIILVSIPGGIFQAKVLDFGVAFPRNKSVRMTTDGEVFGTPAYMSPEQTRGRPVEAPSDIYALGVVLYEMLTGVLPFEGGNSLELMMKHVQEEPPSLAENLPYEEVPEGLEELLERFLAKEPGERYQNGAEVRSEIAQVRSANGWGSLEVDSTLELEEALSKWVLPKPAPQVTVGQRGDGVEHEPSSPDESGAMAARETGTRREGIETGVQPAGKTPEEKGAEEETGIESARTTAQRAFDSRESTERQEANAPAFSTESLKKIALVMFGLSVLFAGSIGGYILLARGGAESEAETSEANSAAPAKEQKEGGGGEAAESNGDGVEPERSAKSDEENSDRVAGDPSEQIEAAPDAPEADEDDREDRAEKAQADSEDERAESSSSDDEPTTSAKERGGRAGTSSSGRESDNRGASDETPGERAPASGREEAEEDKTAHESAGAGGSEKAENPDERPEPAAPNANDSSKSTESGDSDEIDEELQEEMKKNWEF